MSNNVSPVCRTCLRIISDDQIAYDIYSEDGLIQNVRNIGEMVKFCVPELDLFMSPDPLICEECLASLVNAYNFKVRCMRVENAIRSLFETSTKWANNRVDLGDVVRKKIYESLSRKPEFSGKLQDYMEKVDHCLNVPAQVFNKDRLLSSNIHKKVVNYLSQNGNFESNGLVNPMEVIKANGYTRKEAVICSGKNYNDKYVDKIKSPVTRRTYKRRLTNEQIKQEILSKRRRLTVDLQPQLPYLHKRKQLVVKLVRHPLQRCVMCDFMTLDIKMMTKHTNESHVFCKMCNYKCNRKAQFKLHLEKCHPNERHNLIEEYHARFYLETCNICRISGLSKLELSKHLLTMHVQKSNSLLLCPYQGCDVQRRLKSALLSHIQSTHEIYDCPICNFSTNKKNGIKQHVTSHGAVTCAACRETFSSRKDMNEHEEVCNKNFPVIEGAYVGNNLVVDKEGKVQLKRYQNNVEMPSLPELLCAQILIEAPEPIEGEKSDCVVVSPEITTIYLSDEEAGDIVEVIDLVEDETGNSLLKLALTNTKDPLSVDFGEDIVADILNDCLNKVFEQVEDESPCNVLSDSEHLIISDTESVRSDINSEPTPELPKVFADENNGNLTGPETLEVVANIETSSDSKGAATAILNHILERVSNEASNKDNISAVILQSESNSSLIGSDLAEKNDPLGSELETNNQILDNEDLFRTIIGV